MQKRLVSIDEHLTQDVYGTDGTTIAQTYWYHANARNDTVAMTDQAGNVVLRLAYSAYGQAYKIANTGALADLSTEETELVKYGFQGREIDVETGFLNFRNRIYNPVQGRFLQRDPIGFAGGMNLYEFTGGSPHNRSDSLGLDWATDQLCFTNTLVIRNQNFQKLPQAIGNGINKLLTVGTGILSSLSSITRSIVNNFPDLVEFALDMFLPWNLIKGIYQDVRQGSYLAAAFKTMLVGFEMTFVMKLLKLLKKGGKLIGAGEKISTKSLGATAGEVEFVPYTGKFAFLTKIFHIYKDARVIRTEVTKTTPHESLHLWVNNNLPRLAAFERLPVGAPIRYLEELSAYAYGAWSRGGLGMLGILESPINAAMSLPLGHNAFLAFAGGTTYFANSQEADNYYQNK